MATLLPEGKQSFNTSAGVPLVGGKLYTYDAGTSTPRTTYQDAAGTVPNTNPIVLDARGEATVFWSGVYKVVLKDASESTVWAVDNVADGAEVLRSDLSAPTGSGLVGYMPDGVGAVGTTVDEQFKEIQAYQVIADDAPFYAKGDAVEITDAAMTTGSNVLVSVSGPFTADAVGKLVFVTGAGAAGVPLATTITGYTSPTQVTTAANAAITVTGKIAVFGTDNTAAINAAIVSAYADGASTGNVHFRATKYLVVSSSGTQALPGDDGTVKATFGTTMAAETVESMPYALDLKQGVHLVGNNRQGTMLIGPWLYGSSPVDVNQIIGVRMGTSVNTQIQGVGYEDIQFRNFLVGGIGVGCVVSSSFKHVCFSNCAIPQMLMCSERNTYEDVRLVECAAGIVHGGWWTYRNDSYTLANLPTAFSPAWTDKTWMAKIDYTNNRTHTACEDSIDSFFDTYFFKTANNGTRLSTAINAEGLGSVATLVPYKGITDCPITVMSRYGRPNYNDSYHDLFAFGNARYCVNWGRSFFGSVKNLYAERVGFYDKANYGATKVFGVDYVNPYAAGKIEAAIYGVSGQFNSEEAIWLDPIAAVIPINTGSDNWNGLGFTATYMTTSQPAAAMRFGNVNVTNANTLDWYQESTTDLTVIGTGTAGTGTYANRTLAWTRIGDTVFYQGLISYTGHTGNTNIKITGLPYAASTVGGSLVIGQIYGVSGIPFTTGYLSTYIQGTDMFTRQTSDAGTGSGVPIAAAQSFAISGHYKVAL